MKFALLLVFAAGCATAPRTDDSPLINEEEQIGRRPAPEPAEPAPAPVARVREGRIDRAVLDRVLDAGPGVFLAGLEVDADVEGKRFHGWRVVSFFPQDPRYAGVDLVPGDLVVRVNGRVIVRPEHFQEVWDGLRRANALVVEITRGGERFLLQYAIVDKPPASEEKSVP
jgi:hypothetical protein